MSLPETSSDVPAAVASLKRPAAMKSLRAKKTRVIVLGAGMAGLAAARELLQRGYQVLVLEARDRPGGRLKGGVKTNDREGGNEGMKTLPNKVINPDDEVVKPVHKSRRKDTTTPVDLGGALIHGIDGNPIYALTQQMGIPTQPVSECLLFNETGWPVDTREDERISTMFNDCLEETFERLARLEGAPSSSGATNGDTPSNTTQVNNSNASDQQHDDQQENKSDTENNQPPQTAEPDRLVTIPPPTTDIADSKPAAITLNQRQENNLQELRTISPPSPSAVSQVEAGNEEKKTEHPNSDDVSTIEEVIVTTTQTSSATAANVVDSRQAAPRSNNQSDPPETIPAAAGSDGSNNDKSPSSFGDVFDKVCAEKGAPSALPLFQWHQHNLEVSCGASFADLGYKWNDDEPYGFNGPHVAVKTTWKPIMEGLAEGINILYQSPVKKVVMVVPDPPPQPEPQVLTPSEAQPGPDNAAKPTRKRKLTPAPTPLPSRRSRRLRGDNADARRSSRANKGQKVERFVVNEFSTETYEGNKSPPSQRTNGRSRKEEEEDEGIPHTTVQVTLHDGTVLEAEAVVCTLPLGILKLEPPPEPKLDKSNKQVTDEAEDGSDDASCAVSFYPSLSERKQTAINRLGCGLLNKCILSFPHVFWQDSDFLGVAHPAKSYLVLNAAVFTNKPILTFMYGGSFAEEIEEWTDNEIVADCMEVVRIICGKRDIPAPIDYAVTRWGQERYSRMSFSYVPPGVDGTEEFKAMSEAVYDPLVPQKPVIMFAGEHTTPFHPSTIHGAFLSGIREAYRLDLVVEAEANEFLEFDDEHVYQHTFAVRKLFQNVKSPVARAPRQSASSSSETNESGSEQQADSRGAQPQANGSSEQQQNRRRQHRRRGAATVTNTSMSLRERPQAVLPEQTAPPQRRKKATQAQANNGTSVTPHAKRSRRSSYAMGDGTTPSSNGKAPAVDADNEQNDKLVASLERRTLMRALESYGHNYSYIQSVVLPIYGNASVQRTLPQVRARCQQLIRSIMSTASAGLPKKLLDSWVSKEVYVPPKIEEKQKKKAASTRRKRPEKKPPAEGTRKSSRHQKQRTLMNL
ncbi:specific histone demethylase 1 homolog [Seminavis robusta]|uniref:Specific histone demethylase 1 homolog n=1 Tax=Seminavis robusta TaxID=568900 RepID=A0A9N8E4N2_9STRA|nr:specific histone demethylase 1 homolog [Seminavis robusta]|eukprot:Sro654_g182120.1 specific histone demethylase 1 homolog (1084) ;mRNA; f:39728-42979